MIISIILFAMGLITVYSASNVTAYMLNDADVDGDGWIDYKNFVRLLLNK